MEQDPTAPHEGITIDPTLLEAKQSWLLFREESEELGSLFVEDGRLCFKGNASESARVFFEDLFGHLSFETVDESARLLFDRVCKMFNEKRDD